MGLREAKLATKNRVVASEGMRFDAVLRSFIDTRKRGTSTAKKIARPRTIQNYESDLTYFFDFMQQRYKLSHWNDIKVEHFDGFIDWVQQETKWGQATQFKRLRSLRVMLWWIMDDDECAALRMQDNTTLFLKHLPSIPKFFRKKYVPTINELRTFAAAIPRHTRSGLRDATAFNVWLSTGMRQGELRHLKLEDAKLDDGALLVPEEGKTGSRIVYLDDETIADLRRWIRARSTFAKCDYLFVTDEGNPCAYEFFFSQRFARLRIKAGMDNGVGKNITPHMLRHFFATQWVRGGGDLPSLQAMTGHKRLETLEVYMHMEKDKAVQEAHRKFSPRRAVLAEKSKYITKVRAKIR